VRSGPLDSWHTPGITARSEGGGLWQAEEMMRRLFTWRVNLYRLIVGAVVLAIVIPSWAIGVAMWLVASGCILVVVGVVVVGNRVPSVREWLCR
jgi:hypothetical protein